MQLLFLDESGAIVQQNKKHTKFFVIGGIIIPENCWRGIYKQLNSIKRFYNINSEIKWRFFSPHNNEEENGMKHLSFEERNRVRDSLYNIISSYKSVKIISTVTDTEKAYQLGYTDLYWLSYKQTVERF